MGSPAAIAPLPRRLHLELTSRCNADCATCARRAIGAPERELSTDEVRRAIDGLALESAALHVNGEPLLYRPLRAVLRLLAERGVATELNTNGLLLDARRRHALLDGGLARLNVSLDAATVRTHRRLRGPGFARDARHVAAFARERGAAPGRTRLALWMVAARASIRELPALVRLAADLGADEVFLQRLVVFGAGLARGEDSLHGRAGAAAEAIAEAEAAAARLGVALCAAGGASPAAMLAPPDDPTPWRACRRPFESAVVMSDGGVVPCCIATFVAPRRAIRLGNVLRDGWDAVWRGAAYRRFRRALRSARPPRCCRGCGVRWSL